LKSRLIISLAFVLVLSLAAIASAQDDTVVTDDDTAVTDDTAADDDLTFAATVEFSTPDALEAETAYDFRFTVANTTSAEIRRWIFDVEMFLPTANYVLDEENLTAPEALHGGTWEASKMEDTENISGIKWMFTGVVTSESYGDIREGESLDFAFTATTDAESTDGFDWRLIAYDENAEEYELYGTAYIYGGDDDVDDTGAGDDSLGDDDLSGGGDDDSGGGCGC